MQDHNNMKNTYHQSKRVIAILLKLIYNIYRKIKMTNLEKYKQLLRSFDDKIDSLHLQTYEELQSYRRTIIKELIQLYKKTLI